MNHYNRYSSFVNWELWWPNFPILVYFKETQTKPEGQVHFFPVIFVSFQFISDFSCFFHEFGSWSFFFFWYVIVRMGNSYTTLWWNGLDLQRQVPQSSTSNRERSTLVSDHCRLWIKLALNSSISFITVNKHLFVISSCTASSSVIHGKQKS